MRQAWEGLLCCWHSLCLDSLFWKFPSRKRKHEEGSPSVSGRHACAGRRHSQQSGCDVACTPERAPFPRDVEFFGSSPVTEDLHSGTRTGSDSAFSSLTEDVKEVSTRSSSLLAIFSCTS